MSEPVEVKGGSTIKSSIGVGDLINRLQKIQDDHGSDFPITVQLPFADGLGFFWAPIVNVTFDGYFGSIVSDHTFVQEFQSNSRKQDGSPIPTSKFVPDENE